MMTLMMRIGESMRLDLESGSTKCISDDIKINYMTVGNYSIVNPNEALHLPASHKIYVTVSFSYIIIYDSILLNRTGN